MRCPASKTIGFAGKCHHEPHECREEEGTTGSEHEAWLGERQLGEATASALDNGCACKCLAVVVCSDVRLKKLLARGTPKQGNKTISEELAIICCPE